MRDKAITWKASNGRSVFAATIHPVTGTDEVLFDVHAVYADKDVQTLCMNVSQKAATQIRDRLTASLKSLGLMDDLATGLDAFGIEHEDDPNGIRIPLDGRSFLLITREGDGLTLGAYFSPDDEEPEILTDEGAGVATMMATIHRFRNTYNRHGFTTACRRAPL